MTSTCGLEIARIGSGFAVWSSVPAVEGLAFSDEASDGDDRVGEGDESVNDFDAAVGAEGELLEAAVVPGVRPVDWPSAGRLQRCGCAFRGDLALAAELVE